MANVDIELLVHEYRAAISKCREIYLHGANRCVRDYPHVISGSPDDFVEMMDDLHRGLVVKVYLSTALIDHKWHRHERVLAQELFAHVWGSKLEGDDLVDAMTELSKQANKLTWYSLVRPFADLEPLREFVGELETVVYRMALLVAKVDGTVAPSEQRMLRTIKDDIGRHLRPISLDEHESHEDERNRGKQAIESLGKEIKQVRQDCELTEHPTERNQADAKTLEQLLQELEQLTGLAAVKQEIRTMANVIQLRQHRQQSGLPVTQLSLHMVFAGNPGTGKTTVARLVARILHAMGVLQKGQLIETDRSGLVAEYAGQTGPKTNKRVDEAIGGVLFVDEAYSLVADGEDPFGREAIQTLLKRMEDDRDKLVVVLAGYPEPMEKLLKTNPGLSSRFNRNLDFEDYQPVDLCKIFERMASMNQYRLKSATRLRILEGLSWHFQNRDEHFGNGRLVRNIFEDAIRNLANRVASVSEVTRDLLTKFEPTDVAFPQVPENVFAATIKGVRLKTQCPGCDRGCVMPATMLGNRVRCPKCEHKFAANWGELIE